MQLLMRRPEIEGFVAIAAPASRRLGRRIVLGRFSHHASCASSTVIAIFKKLHARHTCKVSPAAFALVGAALECFVVRSYSSSIWLRALCALLRSALALASIQRKPSSIMLARNCSISVGDAGRPVIILCIARTPSNERWAR